MSGLVATIIIGVLAVMQQSPVGSASAQDISKEVPFTRLVEGEQSGVTGRVNYVLSSPEELNALWKMIGATTTPPVVDFQSQSVLAVFADAAPESKVTIAKIEDSEVAARRVVSIVIAKPEQQCGSAKAVTSPYELVAVAATSLSLTHEDIIATTSCQN